MDPVTQGLLGAAVSQACFTKKLGRKAWQLGALAGMAPDLDILIRSQANPLLFILYHRQFTHALSFIPIGGLIVAAIYLLFCKSLRPHWLTVFFAATLAYATHGILDACTSYGTVLLWPFSYKRIAWDIVSIIDPVFTLLLLLGVATSAIQLKAKPAILGLIAAMAYLGFANVQHYRATTMQQALIHSRQQTSQHARVTPTLANVFIWRSIYRYQHKIYLDTIYTPLLSKSYARTGIIVPSFNQRDIPKTIKRNKMLLHDFEVFNWFSDGFVTPFSNKPLRLVDARYLLSRKPLIALWGIEFPDAVPTQQHVRWIRRVKKQ